MKKVSKLMALALALFMVLSLAAPAKAANYTPIDGTMTEVNYNDIVFDKYLVVDKYASIPDIEFEYEITAGAPVSNPASDQVKPGPTPDLISIGTAAFAPGESTYTTLQDGDKLDWTEYNGKMQYAKKQVTIDFSNVVFNEPGIYRYVLEEKLVVPGRDDVIYDTQVSDEGTARFRYIDVYVEDVSDSTGLKLKFQGAVMHEVNSTINSNTTTGDVRDEKAVPSKWNFHANPGTDTYDSQAAAENAAKETVVEDTTNPGKWLYNGEQFDTKDEAEAAAVADVFVAEYKLSDKNDFFVNEIITHDMEFGKKVQGNQGSKDKYFKFELKLSNIPENTTITVDITKADETPVATSATDSSYTSMSNANGQAVDSGIYTYTFGSTGEATLTFYLKHDQYVGVKGLPVGAVYALSETEEDYKKEDGTDVATKQVLTPAGSLENKHMDPVSGTIGSKVNKTYEENANGMFWKDGTEYKPLYKGTGANADKVYKDVTLTEEYDGTRYAIDENVYTGYTNTRGGVIPTGVILAAVPGTILAGGALVYLFGKKRHEDEE